MTTASSNAPAIGRETTLARSVVWGVLVLALANPLASPAVGQTIEIPAPAVESLTLPPPDNSPAIMPAPGVEGMLGSNPAEGDLAPIDMTGDYELELDERHLNLGDPALTESSETWLRRGWWYTRVDAVVLQRTWTSADIDLMFDASGSSSDTDRALTLRNSNPGREGNARITLGRFLFRDTSNRDHTTEFTFFGGGEFGQNASIVSDNPFAATGQNFGRLSVFSPIDQGTDVSFDGAESSQYQYDSRFNSFELNYVVTSRLQRDRMELMPDGEWIRRTNAGWTYHGVFGLRYLNLDENLTWDAQNIQNTNILAAPDASNGTYAVSTVNNMFGPQFGGGLTYQADRVNVTFEGMLGVLANDAKGRSTLAFVDRSDNSTITTGPNGEQVGFSKYDREPSLSFVGQFGLTGRWHMRPNLSLRAGYELMLLTAIALAPNELNFAPTDGIVAISGDSFYHGISMGFEGYW